ncbi:esterase/lipase family protein [Xanthomonas theicola]|uniref:Cobalamin adenosyltransferase n=1 Tax=Xanthomonas theicola TaxID=56464 RepID=A0A2S6ZM79_9XANT|nr:alpha/beta fold hydrolase [Xanthomonas theicola]PPT93220.1 cobalamin adenosyltransferase [Xanthomonas theicola]QNH24844.1 alpha/beta fold hydrolase [Xanthomonas theicola]
MAAAHHAVGAAPLVLLLHGIWNGRAWLGPLAWRLRRDRFRVATFGYSTVFGGAEAALPRLLRRIERLAAHGPAALVGHSLGGLIALDALRQALQAPVTRVVCLGMPLAGSAVAQALLRRGLGAALGRSAGLLQRGLGRWDGPAEVGMVAGSVAFGLGNRIAALGPQSDGTVALAETRLPGLRDHCMVRASHGGLLFSPLAARQAAAFLRHGRFAG